MLNFLDLQKWFFSLRVKEQSYASYLDFVVFRINSRVEQRRSWGKTEQNREAYIEVIDSVKKLTNANASGEDAIISEVLRCFFWCFTYKVSADLGLADTIDQIFKISQVLKKILKCAINVEQLFCRFSTNISRSGKTSVLSNTRTTYRSNQIHIFWIKAIKINRFLMEHFLKRNNLH